MHTLTFWSKEQLARGNSVSRYPLLLITWAFGHTVISMKADFVVSKMSFLPVHTSQHCSTFSQV